MSKIFMFDSEHSAYRMHECGQDEYWFYHRGSYPNDPPLLYKDLVDNANGEVIIWDPYFNVYPNNNDQNIFSNIKNDITIKILVYTSLQRKITYLSDVKDAIKGVIPPNKDCRFGMRLINRDDQPNQGSRFFHDRFLIIDETNVYLIGSSVGNHVQQGLSTGIFKVTNSNTVDFINSIFKYYWDNSIQHEIPLTYLHQQ